jgi:hypothetical protein
VPMPPRQITVGMMASPARVSVRSRGWKISQRRHSWVINSPTAWSVLPPGGEESRAKPSKSVKPLGLIGHTHGLGRRERDWVDGLRGPPSAPLLASRYGQRRDVKRLVIPARNVEEARLACNAVSCIIPNRTYFLSSQEGRKVIRRKGGPFE